MKREPGEATETVTTDTEDAAAGDTTEQGEGGPATEDEAD